MINIKINFLAYFFLPLLFKFDFAFFFLEVWGYQFALTTSFRRGFFLCPHSSEQKQERMTRVERKEKKKKKEPGKKKTKKN